VLHDAAVLGALVDEAFVQLHAANELHRGEGEVARALDPHHGVEHREVGTRHRGRQHCRAHAHPDRGQ
jgi:hypothetical protein